MTSNLHTTNYTNTFIEIAEDTKAISGTRPPLKGAQKTVAGMQYELLANNPYIYTSDDILFQVFVQRNDLTRAALKPAREKLFSKGQPCFRASPLPKMYGFGLHFDADGNMALYGMETPQYKMYLDDHLVKKLKAMRSGKKA